MIISGLFTMAAQAKEFYSELTGKNFLEKMQNLGIQTLNNAYDALVPQQPSQMQRVRIPVENNNNRYRP